MRKSSYLSNEAGKLHPYPGAEGLLKDAGQLTNSFGIREYQSKYSTTWNVFQAEGWWVKGGAVPTISHPL